MLNIYVAMRFGIQLLQTLLVDTVMFILLQTLFYITLQIDGLYILNYLSVSKCYS